jgi:hypothetical protein
LCALFCTIHCAFSWLKRRIPRLRLSRCARTVPSRAPFPNTLPLASATEVMWYVNLTQMNTAGSPPPQTRDI